MNFMNFMNFIMFNEFTNYFTIFNDNLQKYNFNFNKILFKKYVILNYIIWIIKNYNSFQII